MTTPQTFITVNEYLSTPYDPDVNYSDGRIEEPDEAVFTQPPALCVEILSPEDRLSSTNQIVEEYLAMGVPSVWVLDPLQKKAYAAYSRGGFHEVTGTIAAAGNGVVLSLADIFSQEDLF